MKTVKLKKFELSMSDFLQLNLQLTLSVRLVTRYYIRLFLLSIFLIFFFSVWCLSTVLPVAVCEYRSRLRAETGGQCESLLGPSVLLYAGSQREGITGTKTNSLSSQPPQNRNTAIIKERGRHRETQWGRTSGRWWDEAYVCRKKMRQNQSIYIWP